VLIGPGLTGPAGVQVRTAVSCTAGQLPSTIGKPLQFTAESVLCSYAISGKLID
jgi:hypothetical protein